MTDIPDDVMKAAWGLAGWTDPSRRATEIARAIMAEREATLDAAHKYTMEHYGFGFLGHPVDRQRIKEIMAKGNTS